MEMASGYLALLATQHRNLAWQPRLGATRFARTVQVLAENETVHINVNRLEME